MWGGRRTSRDFRDEIQAHIDLEIDSLIREGMSPEQARAEAVRRFGNTWRAQARFTFESNVQQGAREILSTAFLMLPLIATGLLLTAAGVYGVMAFAVTRRAKELAVRAALGATGQDILRLILGQSLRLVGVGVFLGIGATFGLSRMAQGAGDVFDSPGGGVFVLPVLIVAGVGVLATWAPSRRARSINPATLLRAD